MWGLKNKHLNLNLNLTTGVQTKGGKQNGYSLWCHQFTVCSVEGHTQVDLSGLSELAREEGGCIIIAHN